MWEDTEAKLYPYWTLRNYPRVPDGVRGLNPHNQCAWSMRLESTSYPRLELVGITAVLKPSVEAMFLRKPTLSLDPNTSLQPNNLITIETISSPGTELLVRQHHVIAVPKPCLTAMDIHQVVMSTWWKERPYQQTHRVWVVNPKVY